MEDKVAVVCVNHNSIDATQKYYLSISVAAEIAGVIVDFVVVDNSDESQAKALELRIGLGAENVDVNIIAVDNHGYFSGLNSGLASLPSNDYRYWLVSNNDIELSTDFFVNLLKIRQAPSCYVTCPRVLDRDLIDQNPRQIHAYSKTKKALLRMYYSSLIFAWPIFLGMWVYQRLRTRRVDRIPSSVCKIENGYGAIYILNQAFFSNCNRLPEDVFLFGEEVLLQRDVSNSGGDIYFDPSLSCFHNSSSSVSALGWYKYYLIQKKSFRVYSEYL